MIGAEMMLKSLGIDPEQIKKDVANIVQIGNSLDARLTAIASDLALIKAALGIQTPETDNERSDEQTRAGRNGSAGH